MIKKILVGAAAVAMLGSSLVLTTAASAPPSQIYYSYEFYSDATYTGIVGYYTQQCINGTIYTPLVTGQTSPYVITEAIGRCPGLGDW